MKLTKTCARCKQEKGITEFFKNRSKKDGYSGYCKECGLKYNKGWRLSEDDLSKGREFLEQRYGINSLSVEDAAYIAGFADGEGCIGLHRTHSNTSLRKVTHTVRFRITNTYLPVLQYIMQAIGHGTIVEKIKQHEHLKDQWEYCVSGVRAVLLLKQLFPYLKVKRLQAEIAFKYFETLSVGSCKLKDNVVDIRDGLIKQIGMANGTNWVKQSKN